MNLVIGGTGLVGSHLILELLENGEQVTVFSRTSSSRKQLLRTFSYYTSKAEEYFNRLVWANGDILDLPTLEHALKGVSNVYHCAAMVSFSARDNQQLYQTNVLGTANIVNACLKIPGIKLCFVSSIAALGHYESPILVDESNSWNPSLPRTMYSISKFMSEMEVRRGMEEGLQAFIINPSVILGPGNWDNSSAAFFPLIHKGLKFYTSGVTGYVDVRDVASTMILLMKSNITGERFLITSENLNFKEFFAKIAQSLKVKPPQMEAPSLLLKLAALADGIRSYLTRKQRKISFDTISAAVSVNYYSNQKICQVLNYSFRPVDETIQHCASLYLQDIQK